MRNTNIIMTKHFIHPAILFMTLMLFPTLGWAEGIKLLHGPYLDMVQEDNATIVWVADKPSVGWVGVASDDGTDSYSVARPKFHDTNIGIKRTSLIHSVKLTNLKPGTRYRYRVYAQDYPILVNSNNRSVTAQTGNGQLDVKVLDLNGKTTFHKTYSAR